MPVNQIFTPENFGFVEGRKAKHYLKWEKRTGEERLKLTLHRKKQIWYFYRNCLKKPVFTGFINSDEEAKIILNNARNFKEVA